MTAASEYYEFSNLDNGLFSPSVLKNKVKAPYVGPPKSKKFPNGVEVNKCCFNISLIMIAFVSLVCTPTAVGSLTGLLLG